MMTYQTTIHWETANVLILATGVTFTVARAAFSTLAETIDILGESLT